MTKSVKRFTSEFHLAISGKFRPIKGTSKFNFQILTPSKFKINVHFSVNFTFMPGPRNFFQRVSRPNGLKTFWSSFFFFFSPQLILQFTEGVQWFYYKKNYIFSKDPEGVPYFPGGGGGGGVRMLISIEIHITCDFPGGGGGVQSPYPPL